MDGDGKLSEEESKDMLEEIIKTRTAMLLEIMPDEKLRTMGAACVRNHTEKSQGTAEHIFGNLD